MNDKQIIERLTQEIEELTKSPWISVHDEKPAYGMPVILCINGVTQKITYNLDGSDDSLDWFEPYSTIGAYDDYTEFSFFVTHDIDVKWMRLPGAIAD